MKIEWKWNQIAIAFLIGLVGGALLPGGRLYRDLNRRFDNRPSQERLLNRFARVLDLTAEQRVQVGAILQRKREKLDGLAAEARPRFEQIRKETGDEIRAVLTPEQQAKFTALEAQMEKRGRKRFPPPPPHP